ncbi:MAG: preprotein translocase subunit SecE [Gemmatimonadales bacterium]
MAVSHRSESPAAGTDGIGGWLTRSRDFLVAARGEMAKVTWPTRDELIKATRMIIILSVVLGLVIGFMDKILTLILVDGVALLAR